MKQITAPAAITAIRVWVENNEPWIEMSSVPGPKRSSSPALIAFFSSR